MSLTPHIKPHNSDKHTCKQSKYDVMTSLPVRTMIVAPSSSGKSVLLQNLILDIYRGCFEKVYIFSPSIHIDSVWAPVKEYLKDSLKQEDDDNPKASGNKPSAVTSPVIRIEGNRSAAPCKAVSKIHGLRSTSTKCW